MNYLTGLVEGLRSRSASLNLEDRRRLLQFAERVEKTVLYREPQAARFEVVWAEAKLGKKATEVIRQEAWQATIAGKEVIFIDTPDYSKTDKRRMDRDLEDIYWFWNDLVSDGRLANIVVAIQGEMFSGHYFLDKMQRFDIKPLAPERMVEAYRRMFFDTTHPFTEDALFKLARMSQGIFRRFLRYVLLTLDFWERPGHPYEIDEGTVEKAIPLDRLAEDMESDFQGLFPKHSELRFLAVRVRMYLREHGPQKQSKLAEELGVERFAMSRLLTKLESAKRITRKRESGTDKMVHVGPE